MDRVSEDLDQQKRMKINVIDARTERLTSPDALRSDAIFQGDALSAYIGQEQLFSDENLDEYFKAIEEDCLEKVEKFMEGLKKQIAVVRKSAK